MSLSDQDADRNWIGRAVVDRDDEHLGRCLEVYADTSTGIPEWLYTELDIGGHAFLPAVSADATPDSVRVAITRGQVASAPEVGSGGRLTVDEERLLYAHYELAFSTENSDTLLPADPLPAQAPTDRTRTDVRSPDTAASEEIPDVSQDQPGETPQLSPDEIEIVATGPGPADFVLTGAPDEPAAHEVVAEAYPPAQAVGTAPGGPRPAPSGSAPSRSAAVPAALAAVAVGAAVFSRLRRPPSRRQTTVRKAQKSVRRTSRTLGAVGTSAARTLGTTGASTSRAIGVAGAQAAKGLSTAGGQGARALDTAGTRTARALDTAGTRTARALDTAGTRTARALDTAGTRTAKAASTASSRTAKAVSTTVAKTAAAPPARPARPRKAVLVPRSTSSKASKNTRKAVRDVTSTVAVVPAKAGRKTRKVRRSWHRKVTRWLGLTGFGAGYLLGAKAGTQRYEQITDTVRKVTGGR